VNGLLMLPDRPEEGELIIAESPSAVNLGCGKQREGRVAGVRRKSRDKENWSG
jgi:hypothetical protein